MRKIKISGVLALLAGCAVLIGCAGEGAGSGSERGGNNVNPTEVGSDGTGIDSNDMGILERKPHLPEGQAPEGFPSLEFLSPKIEKQILEDHRNRTDSVHWPVWMGGYFGTYNGCVVVAMGETGLSPLPPTIVEIIIAGTLFEIPNRFFPSAWKEGEFYTLEGAYDLGLLTRDDIRSIAYYYSHGLYIGYR